MQVFEDDLTCYFDVDDTLVIWGKPKTHPGSIQVDNYGQVESLVPHEAHVDFLKRQKARGFLIVAWSQRGGRWVKNVVKALGIEQYVDLAITKPLVYVDDLKAEEFMTNRVYFRDKKAEPEEGNTTDEDCANARSVSIK
jgi:predicted phosphatase